MHEIRCIDVFECMGWEEKHEIRVVVVVVV